MKLSLSSSVELLKKKKKEKCTESTLEDQYDLVKNSLTKKEKKLV